MSGERPHGPAATRTAPPPKDAGSRRGCPNLSPNGFVFFPLFLGDKKRKVINSHRAGMFVALGGCQNWSHQSPHVDRLRPARPRCPLPAARSCPRGGAGEGPGEGPRPPPPAGLSPSVPGPHPWRQAASPARTDARRAASVASPGQAGPVPRLGGQRAMRVPACARSPPPAPSAAPTAGAGSEGGGDSELRAR